ncbi:MAG: lactonase family protein, partial [Nitrososphaerales archaeon]
MNEFLKKKAAVTSILAISIGLAAIFATVLTAEVQSSGFGNTGAVYTIDNSASGNNVILYSRAPDGTLSSIGTFPTGGLGTGTALASQSAIVLTQDSRWLLAVDAGSNEISVFRVGHVSLTLVSKTSAQGILPISLTVFKDWVYVLDSGGLGNIAGFQLNNDGSLTYVSGSTQPLSGMSNPSPEQIGFSPAGNLIIVTEKGTNIIDTYTVGHNGVASAPTTHTSAGAGPYGFAFTDANHLIVSEAASNTLSSYVVSNTGDLRTMSGAIPTFGNAPCWVVVTGNGQFAYTTNAHGGTISTFSISRTGGLTLFSSIASSTLIPALDMAFSAHGQFLY